MPIFRQGDDAQSSNDGCVTGFPVEELNVDLGGVGSWTGFVVGSFEAVGVVVVLLLVSPGRLVVAGGAVVFVVVVVVVVVLVDDGLSSANDFSFGDAIGRATPRRVYVLS